MGINIVLVEPEIPQNTGNIARTCAALQIPLHLVHPLAFDTSEKQVRRAGLDYWHLVKVIYHSSLAVFLETADPSYTLVPTTKKAELLYSEYSYPENCYLLFGYETEGLPDWLVQKYKNHSIRIPTSGGVRSLNLSNAAAIIAYEASRQHNFFGLR